ncbi:MAG: RluA family pseudouridine synthase [Bacteroidales bacterium]|nr:RluA family pseudouridine synthase [Candidatus Physcousia equi]
MRNQTGADYAASKYHEFTVRQATTLTQFIEGRMSGISRNRLKDILRGHGVTVDRKLVTQYDYPLQPGQVVRISKHRRSTELQNKWVKILYEDKDIIVIEKATGILSMAATAKQFCVKTVLDEYFQRRHFKCHAHCVHRLDRDTSGIMIYAKSIEAAQVMQEDWKGRVFDRRYCAVVVGEVEHDGGTLRSYLQDNKAYITYSTPVDPTVATRDLPNQLENGARLAVTHYHTLHRSADYSLVEMRLETGRKNQIRVHMQDIGHPVVGDPKYGLEGQFVPNPLHRLCLHAYRLFFYHPMTGERMEFETPIPTAFRQLVGKL